MYKFDFITTNYQKPRFWAIIFLMVIIALGLRFCNHSNSKKKQETDKVVIAAYAHTADVPVYINTLGTVTPLYTITVRTQISGIMQNVFYKEGQIVKKGELLAQIDPRPYEAQLLEYQGQLERDKALLENAKVDLERYKTLWSQNSISQQTYQTQKALVQQYEGTVKFDQGLIDTTLVNLLYCKITSPIDGRIGLRLVDPGNYVQPADTTGIAIVTTLTPIDIIFPIAEDYIPEVIMQMESQGAKKVDIYDRQQIHLLASGKVLTIDNQINTATGTVNLKAQVTENTNLLFAKQFVNVRLLVKTLTGVTVVPTAAIQYRDNKPLVYVINQDNKITLKKVKASFSQEGETVVTGIAPGEKVVIEGADDLIVNDTVRITNHKELELQKKEVVT